MAYKIIPTCTACGACLPVCSIDAISVGEPIYVIDQALYCDFENCLATCPVEAIVPHRLRTKEPDRPIFSKSLSEPSRWSAEDSPGLRRGIISRARG